MRTDKLSTLKALLNSNRPPIVMDLKLLQTFIDMDWRGETEDEDGILCEIIIRLSVDVIVCTHELTGPKRARYFSCFNQLAKQIESSAILASSTEFQTYFADFKGHLADF